jgi:hypothetical protein
MQPANVKVTYLDFTSPNPVSLDQFRTFLPHFTVNLMGIAREL